MTDSHDGYNWLLVLEKGDNLHQKLVEYIKQQEIKSAWISVIGGATEVELGFYDLSSKQYRWKVFNQTLEITSLSGNIAWESDEPLLHLHGNLSDENYQTIGGHIKNLVVGGTCEIFIHRWYGEKLRRVQDEDTGLKLLSL